MKTLIIMPLAEQRGGGELMLWHLMQQGRDQGVDWMVVFQEDGPMVEQVRNLGVPVWVMPAPRLRQLYRIPQMVKRIADLARHEQADVLLSWMAKPHLYGSFAARQAGIPALWYQLGLPTPQSRLDIVATALPARGILTCSLAGAKAQARLWPARPLQIVHPGVELERFDQNVLPTPMEARRKLGLPITGPLIGIVGRLQRWKGIHVLIEAMPQVLQRNPDAHCVIVGGEHSLEADYPVHLKGLIDEFGLQEKVIMAGLQRNVPEWMQAMDVIVHASDHEPFGIVVIEAMALGKPVVAGNAAGPTEVITDGVNGLLTPYGDASALAGAITRYLDDPAFAAQVGLAARERAQDFSTQHYARNLIAALRKLITPGNRQASGLAGKMQNSKI